MAFAERTGTTALFSSLVLGQVKEYQFDPAEIKGLKVEIVRTLALGGLQLGHDPGDRFDESIDFFCQHREGGAGVAGCASPAPASPLSRESNVTTSRTIQPRRLRGRSPGRSRGLATEIFFRLP